LALISNKLNIEISFSKKVSYDRGETGVDKTEIPIFSVLITAFYILV